MRRNIGILVLSFTAGILGAISYDYFKGSYMGGQETRLTEPNPLQTLQVDRSNDENPNFVNLRNAEINESENFISASKAATNSVVYIKNISSQSYGNTFFDLFFGNERRDIETVSSGSGVILSGNGYIVTNNHVIKGADKIEVVHDKTTQTAELVGTDPSTDLAVLKIDGSNLPAIEVGRSSEVQVGEWVLAIGNPFNLTSTVTAGIVSAKGRELNILEGKFPIESFIQTDAAINPGNSGGALVNRQGQLIGINTAIISRTGSYAGYGFAVPSDVMNKIVTDLIEYGEVQKAFIGANVIDLDSETVNRLGLNTNTDQLSGVVINRVVEGEAAEKAGLKERDIITKIDDIIINSRADFEEVLSYHSPGDMVTITYMRGKHLNVKKVTLTNREGTTDILMREIYSSEYLGADFEVVSKVERDVLNIEHGVKVTKVYDRGLINSLNLEEGFIVTTINYTKIKEPEALEEILSNYRGRVRIEGVDPSGRKGYYTFYLR